MIASSLRGLWGSSKVKAKQEPFNQGLESNLNLSLQTTAQVMYVKIWDDNCT